MRLIDADALLNRMQEDPLFDLVERYGVSGVINAEPTVDAVPVIRCKDCKYYKWEIDMCNLPGATVFPMNVVHEDDYCSRAEEE